MRNDDPSTLAILFVYLPLYLISKARGRSAGLCTGRTGIGYPIQTQKEHHTGRTPLTRIPNFKPIERIVLDSMHLLFLGIMKRLLSVYWIGSSSRKKTVGTMLARESARISRRLENLRRFIPHEFPRKIRGLVELARFKATEFRFFTLYCGPVVLRNKLPMQFYKHFLLFHVASRIMCCAELSRTLLQYAKDLCKHFFDFLPDLYGADSQDH